MMNSSEWHASRLMKRLLMRHALTKIQSSASTWPADMLASPSSLTPPTDPRPTRSVKVVLALLLTALVMLLTCVVLIRALGIALYLEPWMLVSPESASTQILSISMILPHTTRWLSGTVNNV